jgi:hypothetical protein
MVKKACSNENADLDLAGPILDVWRSSADGLFGLDEALVRLCKPTLEYTQFSQRLREFLMQLIEAHDLLQPHMRRSNMTWKIIDRHEEFRDLPANMISTLAIEWIAGYDLLYGTSTAYVQVFRLAKSGMSQYVHVGRGRFDV